MSCVLTNSNHNWSFHETYFVLLLLSQYSDGQYRLRDPRSGSTTGSQYSGLVQVYYNSQWGTICHNSWTFTESTVLCRSLGYGSAVRTVYYGYNTYGSISGPVWLDSVYCPSYSYSMYSCSNNGVGNVAGTCYGHRGDVGVVCTDSKSVMFRISEECINVFRSLKVNMQWNMYAM